MSVAAETSLDKIHLMVTATLVASAIYVTVAPTPPAVGLTLASVKVSRLITPERPIKSSLFWVLLMVASFSGKLSFFPGMLRMDMLFRLDSQPAVNLATCALLTVRKRKSKKERVENWMVDSEL